MRKYSLTAAALLLTMAGATAQNKLRVADRIQLLQNKYQTEQSASRSRLNDVLPSTMIVELKDGATVADLRTQGINVTEIVDNFVIVPVNAQYVSMLEASPLVKNIRLSRKARLLNDKSRTSTGVDDILQKNGVDISQAYDGTGVVCGIFDQGVDPNHPAFLNETDSTSRIKQLWHYTVNADYTSFSYKSYSGASLANFTTDIASESHGTHTSTTMAGGRAGSAKYYGMAPNANIIMACGDADDGCILHGFTQACEYGKRNNMPVVINLSMGYNGGAHDGMDAFSRSVDALAKKYNAIICMAAGNEGEYKLGVHKAFTDTDSELKATFRSMNYGQYSGDIGFWMESDAPATMHVVLMNADNGAVVDTLLSIDNTTDHLLPMGAFGVFSSDIDSTFIARSYGKIPYVRNASFDKYFRQSQLFVGAEIDPDNDCYLMTLYMEATSHYSSNYNYTIRPGVIIEGKAGREVWGYAGANAYGSFTHEIAAGIPGWDNGSADGTFSAMACGKRVISVGAYTGSNTYYSRNSDSEVRANNGTIGTIGSFSSYVNTPDGRSLPIVCAPGTVVVSALNSYSVSNDRSTYSQYDRINGRNYAYSYMSGTSMATPAVTGAMALWKQAKPDLTVADAIKTIRATAVQDDYTSNGNAAQWGAGKFNAYRGLRELLGLSGIADIEADGASRFVVIPKADRLFELFVAGETELTATVYNVNGIQVARISDHGESLTFDASGLASGVYILSVQGATSHYSSRVLVK